MTDLSVGATRMLADPKALTASGLRAWGGARGSDTASVAVFAVQNVQAPRRSTSHSPTDHRILSTCSDTSYPKRCRSLQ